MTTLPPLDIYEPAHHTVSDLKYHKHEASSSGATLVAETNKCPVAGMYSQAGHRDANSYPLVRGQLVHTILMHAVINAYDAWPDWAGWQSAVETDFGAISLKNRNILRKNLLPLAPSIVQQTLNALRNLGVVRVLAMEHQFKLELPGGYTYTPRLDLVVELEDGTVLGIDWKTTSMESGAIKDEAAFHGSSTQFQGMYLVLEQAYPGRKVRVAAGLIRLVAGAEALVEIVEVERMNQDYYRDAIRAALLQIGSTQEEEGADGVFPSATPRVGQTSCWTPYGKCSHWSKCHG